MPDFTLRSVKGAPLTHEELDGNFEYISSSLYSINNLTSSLITSSDTGSFLTSAATSSMNVSDAKITVTSALSASLTSSSTQVTCSYGMNVFEYVTIDNHAVKLPQPVTGKSVKVVNKGNTLLSVYPSNVGGQINNLPIDTPSIIPPDGKPYEFICIENPLPGEWTISSPATGQYDSGEISISIVAGSLGGFNPVVAAYDPSHVGLTNSFNNTTWGYNGKNKSNIIQYISGGYTYIAFRPESSWVGISKIKVYTNIIGTRSLNTTVRLLAGGEFDYYSLNDGSILNNGTSSTNSTLFNFALTNQIPGSAVTGSTAYTSLNIGDANTAWGEKIANTDSYSDVSLGSVGGTTIGNKSLGNTPYPFPTKTDASGNTINTGDSVEKFYSSYISFQIQPFGSLFNYGTIPDFKFRFMIEYYQ